MNTSNTLAALIARNMTATVEKWGRRGHKVNILNAAGNPQASEIYKLKRDATAAAGLINMFGSTSFTTSLKLNDFDGNETIGVRTCHLMHHVSVENVEGRAHRDVYGEYEFSEYPSEFVKRLTLSAQLEQKISELQ